MSLPSPNLDDRTWRELVDAARERIQQTCPDWTDLSPHDPGFVVLELFAFLTETMIYRLNRIPEKAYIQFLNLLGISLEPPAAAAVMLRFSRTKDAETPLLIPMNTRVSLTRTSGSSDNVIFTTDKEAIIPVGQSSVDVKAHHCDVIEGELSGITTGAPGFSVTAARPPIVESIVDTNGNHLDLIVGVESKPEDSDYRARSILYEGKTFRIWSEVDNFAVLGNERSEYVVDRITGTVTFAAAARMLSPDGTLQPTAEPLAAVPAAGREVRLWYRTGGGSTGNVAAKAKWSLKDPVPGVEVSNPEAATGGRPAETVQNALIRGPQQIHSLERVVTARDYELVAQQSRAVARAKAITLAQFWKYAASGTVEVLLVPFVPEEDRRNLTFESLLAVRSEDARCDVQNALDLKKPLATICCVKWARHKVVRVTARVVAYRQENLEAMRSRITDKLYLLINPLPTPVQPQGWRFGESLRAFHIFDSIVSEPGVSYVDRVRLLVDDVPSKDVLTVVSDPAHTAVWYAAGGNVLFRSTNDTAGWEPAGRFDATVRLCAADTETPGLLAVVSHSSEDTAPWTVQITRDSGETWNLHAIIAFPVRGLAWFRKDQSPVLLLATERGLFELALDPDSTPVQLTVDPHKPDAGLYAVTVGKDGVGGEHIVVALQDKGGVYLGDDRPSNPFRSIGLSGEDIRVLAMQYLGVRSFLWAGAAAPGTEGDGCRRWELTGPGDPPEKWTSFSEGWKAGSCFGLAFQGESILAASHHGGVLRLANGNKGTAWQVPDFACGLPQRETGRLETTSSVAAASGRSLVLTGTPAGAYLSTDGGLHFALASASTFTETVTIPNTWLFVSGAHEIEVVSEDAG
jgi:hypothetical protein